MSLKLRSEYTCDSGDMVRMVVEVLNTGWNDACNLVSDAGIYGEDGAGYSVVDLNDIEENYREDKDILKVLREIKKANPEVDYFKVLDDF